jgi:hypothetical protein
MVFPVVSYCTFVLMFLLLSLLLESTALELLNERVWLTTVLLTSIVLAMLASWKIVQGPSVLWAAFVAIFGVLTIVVALAFGFTVARNLSGAWHHRSYDTVPADR